MAAGRSPAPLPFPSYEAYLQAQVTARDMRYLEVGGTEGTEEGGRCQAPRRGPGRSSGRGPPRRPVGARWARGSR